MAFFKTWYALIFPALIFLHLKVAPYTKVEESFNIQAIHDILRYGVPVSNAATKFEAYFDHMTFSGSVPRTFIGSLLVAFFVQPIGLWQQLHGIELQVLVRAVLGLMNATALFVYARAVRWRYGNRTAMWFTALQASQFHVFYYASRTLPNMFAFCLSTFALAAGLLDPNSPLALRRQKLSLYLLTLGTIIFRSELILLLGPLCLQLLLKAHGTAGRVALIKRTIFPGILAATIVGVALTVTIDTYFWQSPDYLWPEASAFLFNIFPTRDHEGASAWGTSPWYWYFTSAIPRLINPCVLLLPYGILFTTQRQAIMDQLLPPLLYTTIYSFVPHKEVRFLFPIIPQLTLSVALSASYISLRRQFVAKIATVSIVIITLAASFLSHAVLLPLSAQSYPGGEALTLLHRAHYQMASSKPQVNVYLTNLALQTGITRFLEQPIYPNTNSSFGETEHAQPPPEPVIMPGSPDGQIPALTYYPKSTGTPQVSRLLSHERPLWKYEKVVPEDIEHAAEFWDQFDYVIVEDPSHVPGSWRLVGTTTSLGRQRPHITHDHVHTTDKKLLVLGTGDDAAWYNPDSPEMGASQADEQRHGRALYELLVKMYGVDVAWVYGAIHDILVEGYGVGGRSVTRGRWIEWGLEPRLFILAKRVDMGSVDENVAEELSQSLA